MSINDGGGIIPAPPPFRPLSSFQRKLESRRAGRWVRRVARLSPGDPAQKLLPTGKAVFGMSICYEAAYGAAIRRALPAAHILINVSNDAWFGDSLAPHQHL